MGVTLTIAGVDRRANVMHSSLRITKDDEVELCTFETRDPLLTAAAYRPAYGDVVRVHQNGSLLFGGTVEGMKDAAADGLNAGSTRVKVRAVGYHVLPDKVTVRKTYAAGLTTLEVYADLFATLTTVTYIGAASGGPVLPALAFDRCKLSVALNQIKRISGYPWRINGDLQGWAGAPGSDVGASFTFANASVLRGFDWESERLQRATRVWVKTGNTGATARTQTWTGTGARTRFFVDVEPTVTPNHVWEGGTWVAVPSASWTWDSARLCLTRATPLGLGVVLTSTYTVEYPAWCRAQDETAVEAGDLSELIYTYPDVLELDQGVALATGHLAQQAITPKTVTLSTRVVNPYPLQKCALSFPSRLVSGDYLIRSVSIQPFGKDWASDDALLYTLSLIEGTALNANWLDFWRDKLGSTAGAGAAASAGTGVSIITVSGVLEGDLGGSRQVGLIHSTWAPPYEHREWECPADGTYTAAVDVKTANAGTSVTPRIYDVTASADAGATGASASTSTSLVRQNLVFSATAGHVYRLELLASNTTNRVFGFGKVRA